MTLEEAGAKAAESLQRAETVNLELEQKLQRQAWEVRDLAAVKDARCGAPASPWVGLASVSMVWALTLPGPGHSRPALPSPLSSSSANN